MSKSALRIFLILAVISTCYALSYKMNQPSIPQYSNLYTELADEVYSHINQSKQNLLPKISELSSHSQKIISDNNGISYSLEEGIIFQLSEPYPNSDPMMATLTFGLCATKTTAYLMTPQDLKNNAPSLFLRSK